MTGGVYDWRGVHSKLVENDGESILWLAGFMTGWVYTANWWSWITNWNLELNIMTPCCKVWIELCILLVLTILNQLAPPHFLNWCLRHVPHSNYHAWLAIGEIIFWLGIGYFDLSLSDRRSTTGLQGAGVVANAAPWWFTTTGSSQSHLQGWARAMKAPHRPQQLTTLMD